MVRSFSRSRSNWLLTLQHVGFLNSTLNDLFPRHGHRDDGRSRSTFEPSDGWVLSTFSRKVIRQLASLSSCRSLWTPFTL